MKILKVKSREYNGKVYHKYRINLSEKVIKKAGLKGGDELEAEAEKDKIVLRKK